MPDDVHELSALYALDVLSGDERARFEEHLDECDRCRQDIAGLRDAAGALAFAVAGPAPPSELRARVLGAARAEQQNVVRIGARRSFAVSVAAAVAVAASAAAVALGVWAASLHRSLTHERSTVSVLTDPRARRVPLRGAPGQLVVGPSGEAVLSVELPSLPHGKTYEAWVADPSVHAAGVFSGRTTKLRVRVARGAQVMVSVERAGGVDAPTTTPIVSARA
jgi:anti-sigma-K factor RskA